MQKLKRFYKVYTIVVCFITLWFIFRDLSIIFVSLFLMSLPIIFYGTFIFFPNKIFKTKESQQLSEEEIQGEERFKIMYFVAFVFFMLGLYAMNR